MNEVTNIMTIQITGIGPCTDEELKEMFAMANDQEKVRRAENNLKEILGVDDAKIINNQHFVREKGGAE